MVPRIRVAWLSLSSQLKQTYKASRPKGQQAACLMHTTAMFTLNPFPGKPSDSSSFGSLLLNPQSPAKVSFLLFQNQVKTAGLPRTQTGAELMFNWDREGVSLSFISEPGHSNLPAHSGPPQPKTAPNTVPCLFQGQEGATSRRRRRYLESEGFRSCLLCVSGLYLVDSFLT